MLKKVYYLISFFSIFSGHGQILDDFNINHLKDFGLVGKPKIVRQRLFNKINKSLPITYENLKSRGPLFPLGSDVFDVNFDENGRIISETYYKSNNDSIIIHSKKKYFYNENNRLIKISSEYFNDLNFTNDDEYFNPPENRFQTEIYYYEKFDYSNDSINNIYNREIVSKTFNSKQLLLSSRIVKYRRRTYGQGIETNSYTTFYNYDEYEDPVYRTLSIYDRNKRIEFLEMYNHNIESAPYFIRVYEYLNNKSFKYLKTAEIYNCKNFSLKSFEYDSNNNFIKIITEGIKGNSNTTKEYKYKYDDYGNWTEKIEREKKFNKYNSYIIYKREIEYY